MGSSTASASRPLIEVEDVSKRFVLAGRRARDLRERFQGLARRADGATGETGADHNIHWALRDVSFTVERGQTLGIVGHNGSGKSTMLKLLTGIMAPTRGRVHVHGRIGALIEVGAGFHPDLTGRENVYLSGSIQGLSRRELAARFDQIVDFANMGRFIDTPVKRYSSGMFMRLGFSLAVHTDPDLLLIDEVLAVGDTLFQNKCLRHLKDFVRRGGTLVFVSHSMAQVAEVCDTCLWLDHGEMRYLGETAVAVDGYMSLVEERQHADLRRTHPDEWAALEAERQQAEEERLREEKERREREEEARREREEAERREAERRAALEAERAAALEAAEAARRADPSRGRLLGVTLRDAAGVPRTRFRAGEPVRAEIEYQMGRMLPDPIVGFDVCRVSDGLHMYTTSNYDHAVSFQGFPSAGTVVLEIGALNLPAGCYRIRISLFAQSAEERWWERPEDEITDAATFEVWASLTTHGVTYLPVRWSVPGLSPAAGIAPAGLPEGKPALLGIAATAEAGGAGRRAGRGVE